LCFYFFLIFNIFFYCVYFLFFNFLNAHVSGPKRKEEKKDRRASRIFPHTNVHLECSEGVYVCDWLWKNVYRHHGPCDGRTQALLGNFLPLMMCCFFLWVIFSIPSENHFVFAWALQSHILIQKNPNPPLVHHRN